MHVHVKVGMPAVEEFPLVHQEYLGLKSANNS